MLDVVVNKCLRRILRIWWPNKISNKQLWERTKQETISNCITKRKWGWIGHTWRKPQEEITRQAIDWNPPGNRKRGRPKNTWKRSTLKDLQRMNRTWTEAKLEAQNRIRWRKNIKAL
jgi:hypothetical protein